MREGLAALASWPFICVWRCSSPAFWAADSSWIGAVYLTVRTIKGQFRLIVKPLITKPRLLLTKGRPSIHSNGMLDYLCKLNRAAGVGSSGGLSLGLG